MADLAPFEQLPFERLDETPRRPHSYQKTDARSAVVSTDEFGEVETHYRTYGEGPPLLLVHGLMTSSYSWRYVFEPLGATYSLYAPDLPGAGRSDKPLDANYDPRNLARWLAAFQRQMGIRGCPVVGNSLGGYIGMWLALLDADALSSLVNVHGPGIPSLRLRALRVAGHLPGTVRLVAWLARRNPQRWAHRHVHYRDESLKSLEEAKIYGEPLSTEDGSLAFAKYLTESLDSETMGEFVGWLLARRATALGFPVPLLLLYAEEDPMVPPRVGKQLSEAIPDATYDTLAEASHFAQIDAPERFVERILAFLDTT